MTPAMDRPTHDPAARAPRPLAAGRPSGLKRFVITAVGSHGDIHPFVAVGKELRRRGHAVVALVNDYYRSLVEEAGLTFEPLGAPFDLRELRANPDIMHATRGAKAVADLLIFATLRDSVTKLNSLIDDFDPHAVLHHHICFGAEPVCTRRGVPRVAAALAPMMWLNVNDRICGRARSWENAPRWFRGLRLRALRPVFRHLFDRPLNRELRALGYPPVNDAWRTMTMTGDAVLGLWSPTLRGPLEGDPPGAIICGAPEHDRHAEQEHPPDDIARFLAECEDRPDDAPIVFTLGTAAVQLPGDYYDVAAEACRRLGRRAILLTGRGPAAPASLPPTVRAFGYAPFSSLLPRAAATVHHGGIGTTQHALRAGRPMIVVPHAHDQFDNAARVRRLGVSLTIPRARLRPDAMADALRRVLDEPGFTASAARAADAMRDENGAKTAADAMERVARVRARG